MLCWCGSETDEHGNHLTIPEGNTPWSDSQFILRDGYVTHIKGKPVREPPRNASALPAIPTPRSGSED